MCPITWRDIWNSFATVFLGRQGIDFGNDQSTNGRIFML